jgi:hypothetical protein
VRPGSSLSQRGARRPAPSRRHGNLYEAPNRVRDLGAVVMDERVVLEKQALRRVCLDPHAQVGQLTRRGAAEPVAPVAQAAG